MSKRILSIDDEEAVLKSIKLALEAKGYEVMTSNDPAEGQQLIRQEQLDLVMLDIRMPKISGFDIYGDLKDRSRELAVLFVTAHPGSFSLESDAVMKMWEKDFADGNTDVLYKPFELTALADKVEGLIGPGKEESA